MSGEPFPFDNRLERALADDRVPALSPDFADRVVAATAGRAPALPPLRPARGRWRSAKRLALGAVAAGALATTAAATGVLEDFGIDLPSPQQIWTAMTGQIAASPAGAPPATGPASPMAPAQQAGPIIEGPIDSPEELEEAFRRADEARANRRETRRDRIDQRIDTIIERRREAGLPVPTPQEEQALRERLEQMRELRDQRAGAVAEERREQLRERLEAQGSLTREDIVETVRGQGGGGPANGGLRSLRDLPPEERRVRLREMRDRLAPTGGAQAGEPADASTADARQDAPTEPPPEGL